MKFLAKDKISLDLLEALYLLEEAINQDTWLIDTVKGHTSRIGFKLFGTCHLLR
jgi:hypothetical protein